MRKTYRKIFFIFLTGAVFTSSEALALTADELLQKAKKDAEPRYQFALKQGVEIKRTTDQKSFTVLWYPKNTGKVKPPMIVTIHGHGSWAFDEFYLWQPKAQERGYGILAVQWWLGEGERFQDYLSPREIYKAVEQVFKDEEIPYERSLFHGFSRGSANTYAVAALDRQSTRKLFKLFIANAGKPGLDFPPNKDLIDGRFGDKPLRGSRWITYAGALDTHPDRSGIAGMREAKQFIQKYGGDVVLSIEDKDGGHGGFHRRPQNVEAALDKFSSLN